MIHNSSAAVLRDVETLFVAGAVGGLSDSQLLDRFLDRCEGASELAFRALIERHGPMVWGVCRRMTRDPHDAEDAFQATFLVLVRKASSVRVDDSLGRWLYGVSVKVASRARNATARRRARERSLGEESLAAPSLDPDHAELRGTLDEELAKLPMRLRAAVVLCDLQGLTQAEAARQLRCPTGTVKSRLSRGRERLKARLVRRGFGGTMLPAAGVVPMPVTNATVSLALRVVPGGLLRNVVSGQVC